MHKIIRCDSSSRCETRRKNFYQKTLSARRPDQIKKKSSQFYAVDSTARAAKSQPRKVQSHHRARYILVYIYIYSQERCSEEKSSYKFRKSWLSTRASIARYTRRREPSASKGSRPDMRAQARKIRGRRREKSSSHPPSAALCIHAGA